MKKILFVASEAVPFIKTGGLADVVGSLPKYFDKEQYDIRVMIPKYMCIRQEWKDQMKYVTHFYMNLAWRSQYVGILEMEYEGVKFYFIPRCRPWISVRTSSIATTGRPDWFPYF